MAAKKVPSAANKAAEILDTFGSPLHVYDETGIRTTCRNLQSAFEWAPSYRNFFAVKATPTPKILHILHEEGMGFDCSSYAELVLMQKMDISGDRIFFTSNNTSIEEFELAIELGATVNIDDISQVTVFLDVLGDRECGRVAMRYNPGGKQTGNAIIGEPVQAKFGATLEQLVQGFQELSKANIKEFGLHTMVASNERDSSYFGVTARLLREAVLHIQDKASVEIAFVNLGGGFGVAYHPDDSELDLDSVAAAIQSEIADLELDIMTENGRYVTGPNGYLLTKVKYVMEKHKKYIGVDASMQDLMRPGMYGSYHHITLLNEHEDSKLETYDIVGSLCENNDKFAIDRQMPTVKSSDILVIHDTGAHGHSMGFNYNGKLRSAEVLLKPDDTVELIRRAETVDDYFSTIIW